MKKLFVAVLAIAAAVACNTAEVVDLPQGPAIQFENAFVQNATRVGTTTNTLEAFDVWAYIENKGGIVLVDEDVTKGNGQWGYANLQYWAPGHNYYFTALAPMNSANWDYNQAADVVTFTNVKGTEDLLYAYKMVNTDGLTLGGSMEAVKLNFAHLLSKVNFTFTNGFATDNVSVAIKGVEMTAVKNAEVKIVEGTATWSNNVDADLTLAFGDVANLASAASAKSAELLTIPTASDYVYGIKFYVDVYFGTVKAIDNHEFNSTLTGVEFAQGKAYNLAATINAENLKMPVIEFDVNEVKDWVNQDINAGVIGSEIVVVDTIEKLQAALNAATGNTAIAVGADLVGNVTVPELKNATIAINGNGYKFDGTFALVGGSTYGEGTTLIENFAFETAGLNGYDAFIYCNDQKGDNRYPDNVTIKDCTFKGDANAVAAKFRSLKGNLVIENVTVEGHSLLQLASCGEANVLVDGAKVNAGRGISLGATNNATIRNSSFVAESYGIRADGCKTVTNIENTTIEANQPIVVRKVTAAGYVLNVDEASVLNNTGLYQVIFTKNSDDAAYVAPAVDFTFNGPADLLVFPSVIVADNAETLAAALTANQNINVVLANDIDLPINTLGQQTGGSGEYKLGGENTETITIDLNGKKLNVTTTYWSGLGAKNADALFTIKNGTMTSSQASGTWNSYDLCFANCNYNFEDVVFEKAIALEGKVYNLNNVTINETHDYYAMWITAKGQTVNIDGLTVASAGRGIKIDEQYVSAPAKVTLNVNNATFKTAKKAAIVVKSVEGAEINWGTGNSIAEVAADTNFAVWVDEDSAAVADKVVVNGAYSKVEGSADTVVTTADELSSAINNGAKSVYLADGSYTLAKYPAGIELIGCGNDVVLNVQGKKYGVHGDVTIENVKLVFSNDNYTGFQHTNVETYKNCTIVGQPFLYGAKVTFEGCTFEQTSANAYNVWTYGAKAVEFVNCTFNSAGKSVLIYTESGNGSTVLFENCQLNASAPVDGKAAIEIDSSLISGHFDVTINDTSVTGFANGNVSGNSLWNNKKGNKTSITVDGIKVL